MNSQVLHFVSFHGCIVYEMEISITMGTLIKGRGGVRSLLPLWHMACIFWEWGGNEVENEERTGFEEEEVKILGFEEEWRRHRRGSHRQGREGWMRNEFFIWNLRLKTGLFDLIKQNRYIEIKWCDRAGFRTDKGPRVIDHSIGAIWGMTLDSKTPGNSEEKQKTRQKRSRHLGY